MEEVLLDIMFDLPSTKDVEQVIIDENVVTKKVAPKFVIKKKSKPTRAPKSKVATTAS